MNSNIDEVAKIFRDLTRKTRDENLFDFGKYNELMFKLVNLNNQSGVDSSGIDNIKTFSFKVVFDIQLEILNHWTPHDSFFIENLNPENSYELIQALKTFINFVIKEGGAQPDLSTILVSQ